MIQLNGKEVELEKPITLDKLVMQQGYVITQIAVEKNGEIIPKSTCGEEVVRDGDVIEVVTFVGGG
ncbi:sulfur carrier protein [Anaerosporobacter mobilis DSM 15930]|uniref:Sulfur carrier protein n=1 Tax=Anaerosporobacter mobilis DSM 15930 TaxID=1120996 RepID=A0A1M7IK16_9FIRM|nr:sulfur carrier protein ThiS [Anaerosporobacter mobilis]SHM40995.1 sulfur carrier protein [Anaerosporobacter mobilis DSM 15930]